MEDVETRTYKVRATMADPVRDELRSRVRLSFSERARFWSTSANFTVTGPSFALDEFETTLRRIDDDDRELMAW